MQKKTTINEEEIAKFEAMSDAWWDEDGKFRPLHRLNPIRIIYIRDQAARHFKRDSLRYPFKGLRLLDVGCGGGLLSEPMARLGADVVGIDASEKNIMIAKHHAHSVGLDIDYRCTTAEILADSKEQFDIVLNMEVVEHVEEVALFLSSTTALLKPGGLEFIATLNRTPKSYLFAIIGAEYVLRWLPRGTHDWNKFLKPSEVVELLESQDIVVRDAKGVQYVPFVDQWKLSQDLSINYMLTAEKCL